MNAMEFEIELDGRRVRVHQATQEVTVLDAAGQVLRAERIQVAAGSVQGIFSALHEASQITAGGASRRDA